MRKSGPSRRPGSQIRIAASRGSGGGPARWILLPLLWLVVAVVLTVAAILGRGWLPYLVGGAIILGGLLWTLISTLSPGQADRRCPRCGRNGLRSIRRGDPLGVECAECGFQDETHHVPKLLEQ